ncbi:MAG: DUF2232 domain-containing protein [candidate division Zixibacteria bacterium]|nr:DUF2232 domain-containing protein [candidate division Zixibacteria bacterium]
MSLFANNALGNTTGRQNWRSTCGNASPVIVAMLLYSVTLYGGTSEKTGTLPAIMAAPISYVLAMYLYYGIARLTFERQALWLFVGAFVAIGLSCVLIGANQLLMTLAGWGALLGGGVVSGYMSLRGYRPRTVFGISLAVLFAMTIVQFFPLWQDILSTAHETTLMLVEEARTQLTAIGESPERIRKGLESFQLLVGIAMRLIPAEMLLGTAVQFTVGYVAFIYWIERNKLAPPQQVPFMYWKIPFSVMPILIVFAALRLLGGESLRLIADNALAILAVFYSVAGLALVEYYLKKIRLSLLMRILFYIMLLLSPLVSLTFSLVLGSAIALAGFADSFADWRKLRLHELR